MFSHCFCRLRDLRTISNPLAVGPSDRRVERLLKAINLHPTLSQDPSTTNTTPAFLSKAGMIELICQCDGGFIQLSMTVKDELEHFFLFLLFYTFLVVVEVWKQQTLLQLLQVVEMPMLDCILASPDRVQAQASRAPLAAQDLVISNTCLERALPDLTLNLPQ